MQAIKTTFYGPTNTLPPRIKAKSNAGEVWTNWQQELGIDDNHARARVILCQKLGWTYRDGEWTQGWIDDECFHVAIWIDDVAIDR